MVELSIAFTRQILKPQGAKSDTMEATNVGSHRLEHATNLPVLPLPDGDLVIPLAEVFQLGDSHRHSINLNLSVTKGLNGPIREPLGDGDLISLGDVMTRVQ
jgi:hypothetical protein